MSSRRRGGFSWQAGRARRRGRRMLRLDLASHLVEGRDQSLELQLRQLSANLRLSASGAGLAGRPAFRTRPPGRRGRRDAKGERRA